MVFVHPGTRPTSDFGVVGVGVSFFFPFFFLFFAVVCVFLFFSIPTGTLSGGRASFFQGVGLRGKFPSQMGGLSLDRFAMN